MIDTNEFWQLASKYLGGEATGPETTRFFALLEQSASLREEFEEVKKGWQESARVEENYDYLLLERTLKKIRDNKTDVPELPPFPVHEYQVPALPVASRRTWQKWIAAAAIITGVSLLGYWLLLNERAGAGPSQWVTVTVEAGQRKEVKLPDNSIVHLNAGSRLEYPLAFTDSIREIRLRGEAFFNVVPNPRQPFIVETGVLRTRVIGTSFNVRAYPNEATQSVLVATGKVQVATAEKVLDILRPDHLLVYRTHEKDFTTSARQHEEMDWQQDRMAFDDISFDDLAAELGRRYGKIFVFENAALKQCHYRAYFHQIPLDRIMRQLSLTNGFQYGLKGDTILLRGPGCQ